MYVLAVTGGIGSGKSTAARTFARHGAVVLDLDDIAKRLTGPDGPLSDAVVSEFGAAVKSAGGGVDSAALAGLAFASPEDARRLNDIVHPGVLLAVRGALDMLAAQEDPPMLVVLDVPLLVEAPEFFDVVDAVLAISSDEDARLERLDAAGVSDEDARARMACQATDAERRRIADWIIDNDGSLENFECSLQRFWDTEVAPRAT